MISLFYNYVYTKTVDDMIYNFWDIDYDRLKLVILGHFSPFYFPKNPKNQNFENMKKLLEISSFYLCTKNHDHDVLFFNPYNDPESQNFWKSEKNTCRYYPFIHKHHK